MPPATPARAPASPTPSVPHRRNRAGATADSPNPPWIRKGFQVHSQLPRCREQPDDRVTGRRLRRRTTIDGGTRTLRGGPTAAARETRAAAGHPSSNTAATETATVRGALSAPRRLRANTTLNHLRP